MEFMHGTHTGLVLLPDLLCFLRLRVSSASPESGSFGGLELAAGSGSCSLHTAFQHVIITLEALHDQTLPHYMPAHIMHQAHVPVVCAGCARHMLVIRKCHT